MSNCYKCNKEKISSDEIGLTKKFEGKDKTQFLCLDCLANKYKCSKENLISYANRLKKQGCTLFSKINGD